MSNRRKKRAREAQERVEQVLRAKVRLDGVGEDPAIAAFITQMPTASQSEAVELALALDRYLRGDQSVLDNPKYAEHISKMKARAHEIDDAERMFMEDPDRFAEETFERASKIRATGDKKARMEAKAAKMYAEAREQAVAGKATKQLQLDWLIENGPKEDVECPGVLETFVVNGAPSPRIMPIVVRVMHRSWVLRPGMNLNVPLVFADHYRAMNKARFEGQARGDALQQGLRARELEDVQGKIDVQYGSRRALDPRISGSDQGR